MQCICTLKFGCKHIFPIFQSFHIYSVCGQKVSLLLNKNYEHEFTNNTNPLKAGSHWTILQFKPFDDLLSTLKLDLTFLSFQHYALGKPAIRMQNVFNFYWETSNQVIRFFSLLSANFFPVTTTCYKSVWVCHAFLSRSFPNIWKFSLVGNGAEWEQRSICLKNHFKGIKAFEIHF